MPRTSPPSAADLTLKAAVLLLHADAARIAEARRAVREARGVAAVTEAEGVRDRIAARRAARRASVIAARSRAEEVRSCRLDLACPSREPARRSEAMRPEDVYSDSEYEQFFGHEKPSKAADLAAPAGDDPEDGLPF